MRFLSRSNSRKLLECWIATSPDLLRHRKLSHVSGYYILGAGALTILGLFVRHSPGYVFLLGAAISVGMGIRTWQDMLKLVPFIKGKIEVTAEPVSESVTMVAKIVDGRVGEQLVEAIAPCCSSPKPSVEDLQEKAKLTAVRRVLRDTYVYTPFLLLVAALAVISAGHQV